MRLPFILNVSLNTCLITALEKNKIRYQRLCYNVNLQGATKVTVLNTDARELDEMFKFDKILLDAPCSGSGTIRENEVGTYKNFNHFGKMSAPFCSIRTLVSFK